jgi:hypothetical protein
VGGSADARNSTVCQFPKVTTVGGSAYANGATVCQFPKVTTVGGYADAQNSTVCQFPTLKNQNDRSVAKRCKTILLASFTAAGFSFADGVLARVVSRRGPVSRVIVCGKTEITYVVTDGEFNSHGKTLKEARDGLLYKIGNRDTLEFKKWGLETVVSKRDAIRAYRAITGACEAGVRGWMEREERPEKITVQGIINLTKGAYGAETFKKFFEEE